MITILTEERMGRKANFLMIVVYEKGKAGGPQLHIF